MSGPPVASPEGAACPKASSPALAPASGLVAFPIWLRNEPQGSFAKPTGCLPGRDRDPVWLTRGGYSSKAEASFLLPLPAGIAAFTLTSLRTILKQAGLHSAWTSCIPSLRQRVDSRQRSPWSGKPRNFKALRPRLFAISRSEDKVRLRLDRPVRKLRNPDLSTFPRLICGEGWTTQPFVALAMPARKPIRIRPSMRATKARMRFPDLALHSVRIAATRPFSGRAGRAAAAAARSA